MRKKENGSERAKRVHKAEQNYAIEVEKNQ